MMISNFKGTDLDAILNCWANARPEDKVEKDTFIKKILMEGSFDPNGFFVARDDERILGFVICVYRKVAVDANSGIEKRDGWISAFAVDDRERFFEIGNDLIDKAEKYFASVGKTVISTGYHPLYLFQGFSEEHNPEYIRLFEGRGYTSSRSVARQLDLDTYDPPANVEEKARRIEEEGIYVGPMKDEYIFSLIDSREKFYGSSGAYEFKLRLLSLDYDRFCIAAKDGRIIGVGTFGDPYGSAERFGPIAVSPECQGMGIGTVILHQILREMKKRGLKRAWAQWTPRAGAADLMYKKAGFYQTKTYVTLVKNFEEK